ILFCCFFFFQAEDGIRDFHVTGVQTCALPISTALAARVYTFNLCILGVLWSVAMGVGTQILLAHRIGAGQLESAQRQLRQSVRFAALGGVGIVLVLNLVRVPLLGLFTSDHQVLELTRPLLQLALVLELGRAANVVVGGA